MNKDMPIISIVVPFYNTGELIKNSVNSLLAQTNKSFEVIFVNDGSFDDTQLILEELLDNQNIDFQLLEKANEGVGVARNYGLSHAKGKYIMFFDSDDCVAEHLVESLLKKIKNAPDMVLFGHDIVSSDLLLIRRNSVTGYADAEQGLKLFQDVLSRRLVIHVDSVLLRKTFVDENNLLYNPNLPFGEDLEFNLLALYKAGKVNIIDEQLTFYVQHDASTTSRLFDVSWYGYYISRYDRLLCACRDEETLVLVQNARIGAAAYIYYCIRLKFGLKDALEEMAKIRENYLVTINRKTLVGKYKYMYFLMCKMSFVLYILLKFKRFNLIWSKFIFEAPNEKR
jgi:glycosyltransferase involved in cell wall biosynthesis